MSDTTASTEPCKEFPEKSVICEAICICKAAHIANQAMKPQNCVDKRLEGNLEMFPDTNIVPEPPYYVDTDANLALPLITEKTQTISWRRGVNAVRVQDALLNSPFADWSLAQQYVRGETTFKKIRNTLEEVRRPEVMTKEQKKMLIRDYDDIDGTFRRPDVVLLKDPHGDLSLGNIKDVVEIKFPPDDWQDNGQEDAYTVINNGKKPTLLTPEDCGCEEEEDKKKKRKSQANAGSLPDSKSAENVFPDAATAAELAKRYNIIDPPLEEDFAAELLMGFGAAAGMGLWGTLTGAGSAAGAGTGAAATVTRMGAARAAQTAAGAASQGTTWGKVGGGLLGTILGGGTEAQ